MILFDLACEAGHVFEGWFGSSGDYDTQKARGLLSCPICGSAGIDKAVMAPRVGAKGNQRGGQGLALPGGADAKQMLATLAKMQAEVLKGSEWVGSRFAEEARAIHDGEATARSIHGQATLAEAKALADDGVAVAPLPLPVRAPGTEH